MRHPQRIGCRSGQDADYAQREPKGWDAMKMKPIVMQLNRPKDIQAAVDYAETETTKNNLRFEGTTTHGSGSGHGFAARYAVLPDHIELTVDKKPFWASSSMVKDAVNNFWGEYLRNEGRHYPPQ